MTTTLSEKPVKTLVVTVLFRCNNNMVPSDPDHTSGLSCQQLGEKEAKSVLRGPQAPNGKGAVTSDAWRLVRTK